ncbi:hypothetical protein J3R83DRAFT_2355 [Lanmaoa asiatica]|nr:hypothetical protein J3R83DRAFT_2355 [Lanmaoa asiatica]
MFRFTSNGDPKKTRKIDKIKEKLVAMLRDIGFSLCNGRLPWSTLEGDLGKKGYTILNWPQGVVRDRDKGVSGLSAEDADKLHDALFIDERRLLFVRCDEGKFLSMYDTTVEGLLNPRPEFADKTGSLRWVMLRARIDSAGAIVPVCRQEIHNLGSD